MVYYERYGTHEEYDDEGWCGFDGEGDDDEPGELPTAFASPPGPSVVCGKANLGFACYRCGQPVCMQPTDCMEDSECGAWIMDWWSNGAMDLDDGNEFWCRRCLEKNAEK